MLERLLLNSLVHGVLGVRGRPHRRASRFLTGGGSPVFNLGTLLGAAGLAWGAYEAYQRRRPPESTTTVDGGGFGTVSETVVVTPPPLPPPLPASHGTGPGGSAPDALHRLVALTIAAARCDKELSEVEYGRILEAAREHGAERLVSEQLARRPTVAEIVAGADEPRLKADLYVLAYGIVRADGGTSEVERAWLSELAGTLGLDATAVSALERRADAGIDSGTERGT